MPGRAQATPPAEGNVMTDNGKPAEDADERAAADHPDDPEIKGRYIEGSYGAAGTHSGRHARDEEGQYTEGNYGETGTEGGVPALSDDDAEEAGRFIEADYGAAGSVHGRSPKSEIGRYAEGDYGKDGTAGPQRAAKTNAEPDAETDKD